ncbi:hypothetical protein [Flavobacterium sp. 3HN19-14]
MDTLTEDFSIGLFVWQSVVVVMAIVVIYFTVKLVRRMLKYYKATN